MSKIGLQCPRIMPSVGKRVAASVTQHMRVRLEGELGGRRGALDHAGEAGSVERRASAPT